MLKKTALIILLVIVLILCALLSPWRNFNFDFSSIFGFNSQPEFSTLLVSSYSGELQIYVDSELRGSVGPEGSPFEIEDVIPGVRLIELVRVSDSGIYSKFQQEVNFMPRITTVIAYELGPTDAFSAGHIITPNLNFTNQGATNLNISGQEEVNVTLNSALLGTTPIQSVSINPTTTNAIKLEKEGYETMNIVIAVGGEGASSENAQDLRNVDININAKLFLKPLRVVGD